MAFWATTMTMFEGQERLERLFIYFSMKETWLQALCRYVYAACRPIFLLGLLPLSCACADVDAIPNRSMCKRRLNHTRQPPAYIRGCKLRRQENLSISCGGGQSCDR